MHYALKLDDPASCWYSDICNFCSCFHVLQEQQFHFPMTWLIHQKACVWFGCLIPNEQELIHFQANNKYRKITNMQFIFKKNPQKRKGTSKLLICCGFFKRELENALLHLAAILWEQQVRNDWILRHLNIYFVKAACFIRGGFNIHFPSVSV